MNGGCLKKVNKERNTVLITGSTSGIGEAFASKFQLEGYNLILVGRNEEKLKAQVEKFEKNCNVKYIACELTSENAVDTIVDNLNKWDIKVDILINNVGFNRVGLFNEIPINDELEMVQLHIAMFLRLTKVCLKGMIENNYGYIVNLGSTGSYIASPSDAVYSATKAFILSFTNALVGELEGTGVKVSTICPGATITEFAQKAGIEKTKLFKVGTMKPEEVVEYAYPRLMRGKRVIVPGILNRIMVISSRIVPVSILNKITLWMMK